MPVTVVVGGQYGSEGKGKVTHHLAREQSAAAVVRVGGPNSGHTSFDDAGRREALRQLPMAALLEDATCVIGPGSYVDPGLLHNEITRLDLDPGRVCVDYRAMVIREADSQLERNGDLGERISSTCSGTGAAVTRRIGRRSQEDLAIGDPSLRPYVGDSVALLRDLVNRGKRVIVEGTQGFGLSLLHSPHFPYVTSRDTSAAGALSEAGLSPLDVDDVTMVIRSFPIRVAGRSGPFDAEELDWDVVGREGGFGESLREFTTVTGKLRRVARFDPVIVTKAIQANRPSRLVLNHVDYVDSRCASGSISAKAVLFVRRIEAALQHPIDLVGFGPLPGDLACLEQAESLLVR